MFCEYRLSKYNPNYRDDNGSYKKNEWTSVYDVGKEFEGFILKKDSYIDIENSYIFAITKILKENKVKKLNARFLEIQTKMNIHAISDNHDMKDIFFHIKEGDTFYIEDIPNLCRLLLREQLWCLLIDENHLEIRVGYDFYVFIKCKKVSAKTKNEILENGLFLEEYAYPYIEREFENKFIRIVFKVRGLINLFIRRIKFYLFD